MLVTLTLLAFIVILLVGLASYTRVEVAIASNTQRQEQARANALLALNTAVAHLQKYAGPDRRVTATADAFSPKAGTAHYTGVWDTTADVSMPMTWLVSGNELQNNGAAANPLAVTPQSILNTNNSVALVGAKTSGTANDVLARLVPVTAANVPGAPASNATIGRYAWWVGDQGVKASVAVPDLSSSVTYPPYDTGDARSRIRQQIGLGAGAIDSNSNSPTYGLPVLESRDSNNASLASRTLAFSQLAFLKVPSLTGGAVNGSAALIGSSLMQKNFHAWTTNNFGVLANSKVGGLRQDLSLAPNLLGADFAAWTNYSAYMESPVSDGSGPPNPDYSSDPLRRRYVMQPGSPWIGPVLASAHLAFNFRTANGSTTLSPLQVRAEWIFNFWNPYSSALVPENLRVEVSGLPSVQVFDDSSGTSTQISQFPLGDTYAAAPGAPLSISLPWDATVSRGSAADKASWLPGRIYSWTAADDIGTGAPTGGFASTFYLRSIASNAKGVQRADPNSSTVVGLHSGHVEGTAAQLVFTVYAVRPTGDVQLAQFTSPNFDAFASIPQQLNSDTYQIAYVFHLLEPGDGSAGRQWLNTEGQDLRSGSLLSAAYTSVGTDPTALTSAQVSNPNNLLDRDPASRSFDEDVPVFELPRAPILSMGMLQHFAVSGQRPFLIGNSTQQGATINGIPVGELFDRFYFSGLTSNVTPTVDANGNWISPNPLQVHLRNAAGAKATPSDLTGVPQAYSSKYNLQGGAFNVNSTSLGAWAALLRSIRFPVQPTTAYLKGAFPYLNASFSSGSGSDTSPLSINSSDAVFFRFSQSAQETYEADDPDASGTYAASLVPPPGPANPTSVARTEWYRRGMRTLASTQVMALATKIRDAVSAHIAVDGPFRSLEEFMAPIGSGPSLLEQAILDANINVDGNGIPIDFSSQFLTQADIMTALAPVLFARSDTFLVRAYGEAVNPATGLTEGRAWCEATVQRVPEYVIPSEFPENAPTLPENVANGRRFKIVSFRWLTRSDI